MTGVCVVGSFMADLVVRAPRRPRRGETVIGTSFETFLGGKGFNQAVAAARSGASTAMVGRVGPDDHGRRFLAMLAKEGIDATHVTDDPAIPTGVGMPLVEDSGDNSIIVIPLANHAMRVEHVRAAAPLIESSRVLLLQLELPLGVVVEAARIARRAGVTVVLNPAPAIGDLSAFAGLVDYLVPNETEAEILTGVSSDGDPAASARTLLSRNTVGGVVLTLGARGVLVATDGIDEAIDGWPADSVDSVGAGDAFCGGFAAGLTVGMSPQEAARYGNAAGAIAVTRAGAEPSMPYRAEVLELLARVVPPTESGRLG